MKTIKKETTKRLVLVFPTESLRKLRIAGNIKGKTYQDMLEDEIEWIIDRLYDEALKKANKIT